MAALLKITEDVIIVLFVASLSFSMCAIFYFYVLRFKGIIPSGWRFWASTFDNAINSTENPEWIARLKFAKKLYFIVSYSLLISFALMTIVVLWIDPV